MSIWYQLRALREGLQIKVHADTFQREPIDETSANGDCVRIDETIVDINGLPQLTESPVRDPPAPTIWEANEIG